jgi:hypothetical protein
MDQMVSVAPEGAVTRTKRGFRTLVVAAVSVPWVVPGLLLF